jgi:hypothetical protein
MIRESEDLSEKREPAASEEKCVQVSCPLFVSMIFSMTQESFPVVM